jgi:hypothetical protein
MLKEVVESFIDLREELDKSERDLTPTLSTNHGKNWMG